MTNLFRKFSDRTLRRTFRVLDLLLIVLAYVGARTFDSSSGFFDLLRDSTSGITLWILIAAGLFLALTLPNFKTNTANPEVQSLQRLALWVVSIFGILLVVNSFVPVVSFKVVLVFGLILFVSVFLIRLLTRIVNMKFYFNVSGRVPVAIYGAGAGGIQLIAALRESSEYYPLLLVDDSKHLQGLMISGLRVHERSVLESYASSGAIKKVLFAIPSMSESKKLQVMNFLGTLDCEVQEIPSYVEIIKSGGVFRSLRTVRPEALLGRPDVEVKAPEVENVYSGCNVLITGGGGSIGSELSRRIIEFGPKKLILLDASELALYNIEQELRKVSENAGVELVPVLGSVLNKELLSQTIDTHRIDVILHAAAHKHVPLLEENVLAGVQNNIFGTKVVAELAAEKKVSRFTLISTDKAVRPTNLMGATKRFAELIIQRLQETSSDTIFSMVRFGNVLGSSGSVIPLFKKQIEDGGPVTVTHKDVTRYFMTIPEAARLVLLSNAFSEGGDVFVLDMGEPIKIVDMARQMIELSGLSVRDEENPDGDIAIELSGLRPGEKLFEELLIGENTLPTPHPKIMRAKEKMLTEKQTEKYIKQLEKALANFDEKLAIATLKKSVEGYKD